MRKIILSLTSFFLVFFTASLSPAQFDTKGIDSFSRYPEGEFPTSFRTWPFQRGKAKQVYKVKKEGNNLYLAADDDKNISAQIFREFHWKINVFPYLKWRWRARVLPGGAAENNPATNDSACGVYVLFGKTTGTALKFTWSTRLPAGTVYEKKPGKMYMKILDGGSGGVGQWRWHTINIPEVYKQLFKNEVKREPTGIGILTDGNAVKKPAACDYDDFMISAKP